MNKLHALTLLALGFPFVDAATLTVTPVLDTSIFSEGDNSNALGPLYAGVTRSPNIRRAMMRFDVFGSGITPGSTINSVSLTIVQSRTGASATQIFELRPMLKAWGEGTSNDIGQGGAATPGDATWNYQIFNTNSWSSPGGDVGGISGTASLGTTNQAYTFSSQPGMIADVQQWLDNPGSNFGWMLRATNESGTSAREFGSRESAPASQPKLTITFTAVPEPDVFSALGVAVIYLGLKRKRHVQGSGALVARTS